MLAPVRGGIRFRLLKTGRRIDTQLRGIKGTVPESAAIVVGVNSINPNTLKISATTKPASGPLAPISNNASLFGGNDFCIITAPKVPRGGGPGMK